jgi:hypothetical protein
MLRISLFALALGGLAFACTSPEETAESELKTSKPHLLALSKYEASLGTPIDAFIANPPDATVQKIELVFDGVFKRSNGVEEKVALTQPTTRTEAGATRWTTFGPFANPFTPKDPDIGVFTGKVGVKVTRSDGTTDMDERPLPVRFEVKPSILITELQPTTAQCEKPALRLIATMAYKLKAKALGFDATEFEYAFKAPRMALDSGGLPVMESGAGGAPKYTTTLLNHAVGDAGKKSKPTTDATDVIEESEAFQMPPLPSDRPNYGVIFVVTARDGEGRAVRSTFGMTVHDPLEVVYDGRFDLAQVYAAQPVSGCIPGGEASRSVTYEESKTERRQRELKVTISSNWLKSDQNTWSTSDGKSVSNSKTVTDGYSRTHGTENSFSFTKSHSDTTGVSFNWSDAVAVHGEAKVGFKPFGLGADAGGGVTNTTTVGGSRSSSTTNGTSETNSRSESNEATQSHSTATTDETEINHTDSKGGSSTNDKGGGKDNAQGWTVTSEDTIQRGFGGDVIAHTYGVFYRQMARYTRRAFILEHDKCGESDVVGDVTMQDFVWAPDLALSKECPPLPKTNLPKAQCFLPPCDP